MKRVFAVTMILLLLLCALCPAACAEGGMQKGDVLYFGEFEGEPLRWLVLDPSATNTHEPGVFLLTEQALANQGVIYSWSKAVWQGSEGQLWCSGLLDSLFNESERAAIPAVSKTEEPVQLYGLSWGATSLEEEQVFFISALELSEYIGAKDGDPGLTATYIGNGRGTYYWLRTPHAAHGDYAGLVLEDNQVHDFLVYGSWGARPAANLSGDALVYVSPARRALELCSLGAMPVSEDGEWKAAVVDSSISLTVDACRYSDGLLSLRCHGAPQGSWISLLVKDAEGTAVSYACLSCADGGDESFSLLADLPEGGAFYLFAERDQGELRTNTASAPILLEWEEEPVPTEEPAELNTEDSGSIALAEEATAPVEEETPAPVEETKDSHESFRLFLRAYWMFAIPFAVFALAAIVVAILQLIFRRRF